MRSLFLFLLSISYLQGQSVWEVTADDIDPSQYWGVTSANGVVGIVSSSELLKVNDVILNGVYDNYQRGRVSNILKGFNHLNMNLDINNHGLSNSNVQNYKQVFNMKDASINTNFQFGQDALVESKMMALRAFTIYSLAHHNYKSA